MATKEGPAETVSGSTFAALGACVGAIAIMGIILFKDHPSIIDATIAFCIPILVVFIFQVFVAFPVVRAAGSSEWPSAKEVSANQPLGWHWLSCTRNRPISRSVRAASTATSGSLSKISRQTA
jgi:hypothetical protein